MIKKQQGFSAIEVVIVLVVIGLIGFGGWFVWQRQNDKDNQETTSNTSEETVEPVEEADPYADWKTYEDGAVTFKYPSGWTINPPGDNPTGSVQVMAPVDPTIQLENHGTSEQYKNPQLALNVIPRPSIEGSGKCNSSCNVLEILSIDNTNLPGGKLVISGQNTLFSVVDDPNVEPDSNEYISTITVNDVVRAINADIMYDGPDNIRSSFGEVTNLDEFKKTESFTGMLGIINTIAFK